MLKESIRQLTVFLFLGRKWWRQLCFVCACSFPMFVVVSPFQSYIKNTLARLKKRQLPLSILKSKIVSSRLCFVYTRLCFPTSITIMFFLRREGCENDCTIFVLILLYGPKNVSIVSICLFWLMLSFSELVLYPFRR